MTEDYNDLTDFSIESPIKGWQAVKRTKQIDYQQYQMLGWINENRATSVFQVIMSLSDQNREP